MTVAFNTANTTTPRYKCRLRERARDENQESRELETRTDHWRCGEQERIRSKDKEWGSVDQERDSTSEFSRYDVQGTTVINLKLTIQTSSTFFNDGVEIEISAKNQN